MQLTWLFLPVLVQGWACGGWNGTVTNQPTLQLLAHETSLPAQIVMLLRSTEAHLHTSDFVLREDGLLIEPGQTLLNDQGVAIAMHIVGAAGPITPAILISLLRYSVAVWHGTAPCPCGGFPCSRGCAHTCRLSIFNCPCLRATCACNGGRIGHLDGTWSCRRVGQAFRLTQAVMHSRPCCTVWT